MRRKEKEEGMAVCLIEQHYFPFSSSLLRYLLPLLGINKLRRMSAQEGDAGGGDGENGSGPRVGDPSSSRPRSAEVVWPEHFLEDVAARVAVNAALTDGKLAAAPAIATVFQVCSTWRSISRSELFWEEVTRTIWSGLHRLPHPHATWHDEFARLHRTARNFETARYVHSAVPTGGSSCRCLALSDAHLAAGFSDGTVGIFRLHPSLAPLSTFLPHPQHTRLGPHSEAVSGIALTPDRIVFASRAGDIHVAPLAGPPEARRAHSGNPMVSGPLVDFAADGRRWVGLFAGVPGNSWHVWDGETEELLYVGGALTDTNAVSGWRLLAEFPVASVGRARFCDRGIVVGCTASRIQVMELDSYEDVVGREFRRGLKVDMMDACHGKVMVVDGRGKARVCMGTTLEEVCRFHVPSRRRVGVQGSACMNWGYAMVCLGRGEIRVWNAMSGQQLYSLREAGLGFPAVVAANGRHVSAWGEDTGLHVWDFGYNV